MKRRLFKYITILLFASLTLPTAVIAQDSLATSTDSLQVAATTIVEKVTEEAPATLDSGNTAWMIVATVLVLMMTVPGLALFYGGLVRQKNVLSVIMQCLFITGVISSYV